MNNLNELKMHGFNDLKSIIFILELLFQKPKQFLELVVIYFFDLNLITVNLKIEKIL